MLCDAAIKKDEVNSESGVYLRELGDLRKTERRISDFHNAAESFAETVAC